MTGGYGGKNQRSYSLRGQIAGLFIGLILLSLGAILLVNRFFLENYYVSKKTLAIRSIYRQLGNYEPDPKEEKEKNSGEVPAALAKMSTENNLNWVILNPKAEYLAGWGQQAEFMASRLFGYIYGLEEADAAVLVKGENYIVQKTADTYLGIEYVEMWGLLQNGNICLIRSPLESIRESAQISNGFFLYVGFGILGISGLLVWLITKRITNPISELTGISRQMAELDFNTKYQSHAGNEIDLLGENFNRMSEQLEQTILELQKANRQLQEDIEEKIKIDERRKEFLNNVSHELKTPIALIQGYAEGLKENITDDPESMDFYCEVIIDESAKMNTMVKSLLSLNQIESGQDLLTPERFRIDELIDGVLQSSAIMIQKKEVKVRFQKPPQPLYVEADEFKIEEVVTNYLTNALNHVDEQKLIELRLEERGDTVRICVFNSGEPIPKEALPQIWNKFYKVDKARTREYGGSGIGLSIVKAIIESHHQRCGVRNYENGVEFWCELKKN